MRILIPLNKEVSYIDIKNSGFKQIYYVLSNKPIMPQQQINELKTERDKFKKNIGNLADDVLD